MNAREFLEHEASRLCLECNRRLAEMACGEGYYSTVNWIPAVLEELAPGWDYIETTEAHETAPTIALTQYRGELA